jgi:hypothetical protein
MPPTAAPLRPRRRRSPHPRARAAGAALAALVASLVACDGTPERDPTPESPAFAAPVRARSTVRALADDTLSDAARILRLLPEPDGRTVAVLFADSTSGVTAGLALNALGVDRLQLLWPDSVTNAWWSGPHAIAFTTRTGRGVRAIVDVHAESLTVLERLDSGTVVPTVAPADDSEARARATTYVDSVFSQADGRATRGELTYSVAHLVPQKSGDLVAVYVVASARDGRRSNPSWYLLDRRTEQVTRVDAVIGPLEQLPAEGAGWTEAGDFLYAKGLTIWSAEPTRRGLAWRFRSNSLSFNE